MAETTTTPGSTTTTTPGTLPRLVFWKSEAAKILGISTTTLDREVSAGRMPYRRLRGRIGFSLRDLEKYVSRCARGGGK